VKAEEFNDAVQVVRDWLPQAEAELKFRAISEDEEGILQLIEKHEVYWLYSKMNNSNFVLSCPVLRYCKFSAQKMAQPLFQSQILGCSELL